MSMTLFEPSARLAPFVRAFMVVEVREQTSRLRLPEPGLVLGVRYRGSASFLAGESATRLPDFSLAGMASAARRMRTAPGSGVVLAMFHPAGAAQFFPEPLHELFGATVSLGQLLSHNELDQVASSVAGVADPAARVAALEGFLAARLRRGASDPIVAAAVHAIGKARGAIRISVLSRALAISQDPLEKRFRRAVGATPKQFASLLRVRHAIDSYRPGTSLGQLALHAGYFDQSHFIRELRAVTGMAPREFFRVEEER